MPIVTSLEERVRRHLDHLEHRDLRRRLRPPCGIDLSSNDYLGLSRHPKIMHSMAEAVEREGCGATGSRLLRGERECFAALERRFSEFKQTERGLYFASGYAANLGVLATLPEAGDVVFSDELNHASLIDGMKLGRAERVIFPNRNLDWLSERLKAERRPGQKFLVTESLFGMDGAVAPLAQYAELCRATGTALIVDEAHAVGIYGQQGSGLIESEGVGEAVLLSINTAGKALGVAGAFVAGPAWAIEYLIQQARTFIFSTAPIPAVAAALDAALTVISAEPERRTMLLERASYLRSLLTEIGAPIMPGSSQLIPVVLGQNSRAVQAAAFLQDAGFDVRAIRPPTVPAGTARLRISVNVNLEKQVLSDFASALATALGRGLAAWYR
jgi:8-amino-7-oxononanoate synthase